MPDTSEKTDEKPNKAAAKASSAEKAAASASSAEDADAVEGPKMPTGKFVAATPLQVWDTTLKQGAGGRRIVGIGERIPDIFTPKQLKKMHEAGTITHEFA